MSFSRKALSIFSIESGLHQSWWTQRKLILQGTEYPRRSRELANIIRHPTGYGQNAVLQPYDLPVSGGYTQSRRDNYGLARSLAATRFSAPPATISSCAAGLSGGNVNVFPAAEIVEVR